jgi:hypothetical protein
MTLWMLILLLALIKIPLMAFMLWLPFREEIKGTEPATESESSDEDGGTKTPPIGPHGRHPRRPLHHGPHPRRGPHGSAPDPPERVRGGLAKTRRVSSAQND